MKTIEQRIENLIGQLRAVQKMLSTKKDCVQILIQVKAARGALNSLIAKILTENLVRCSSLRSAQKQKEFEKILTELSKL
ncbi:MAG: metal-sensing transcriptional repressor [Patescibacteria group bacterium]